VSAFGGQDLASWKAGIILISDGYVKEEQQNQLAMSCTVWTALRRDRNTGPWQ